MRIYSSCRNGVVSSFIRPLGYKLLRLEAPSDIRPCGYKPPGIQAPPVISPFGQKPLRL